jgi:hypothetical protein
LKRSILLPAVGAVAACSTSGEPTATITQLAPAVAYNDAPVAMKIQGGPFRPAYRFDTVSGAASIDLGGWSATLTAVAGTPGAPRSETRLEALAWQDPTTLTAALPAQVPVGVYDLHVRDPRGHEATLPRAFASLGPDASAPLITMESPSPDSVVAGGTPFTGTLGADDGAGFLASLTWTVSGAGTTQPTQTCALLPDAHQVHCPLAFTTPYATGALGTLALDATATDRVGLTSSRRFTFRLAYPPVVFDMNPQAAPAQFSMNVVVSGANFVGADGNQPGTVLVADGVVATNIVVVSATEIHGLLPAHDPGTVAVVARTGSVDSSSLSFTYYAVPTIRAVSPNTGPSAGGTVVAVVGDGFRPETSVFFADAAGINHPVSCTQLISPNRILVVTPPGTGTMAVVVSDPVSGPKQLLDAFTYVDGAGTDAGTSPCAGGDGGT